MTVHICLVHDCFTTQAEVSSCDRYFEPENLKCVLSGLCIKKKKSTDLLFTSGAVPFQIMLVFIVPCMTFFFVINAFSVAYDLSQKLMEAGNEPISEFPQNGIIPNKSDSSCENIKHNTFYNSITEFPTRTITCCTYHIMQPS